MHLHKIYNKMNFINLDLFRSKMEIFTFLVKMIVHFMQKFKIYAQSNLLNLFQYDNYDDYDVHCYDVFIMRFQFSLFP